ncbi:hypothetical protein MKX01_029096 [Papaver californicum]|nr:hypothetical protein MKX01_029096 [Papaver californicum]
MSSSSSMSSQIGLFLFAILAFSIYSVSTPYHPVSGDGTKAKCTFVLQECEGLCQAQGRTKVWDVCQWFIGQDMYACTACCGDASSFQPPPPQPRRDPRDECNLNDISLS